MSAEEREEKLRNGMTFDALVLHNKMLKEIAEATWEDGAPFSMNASEGQLEGRSTEHAGGRARSAWKSLGCAGRVARPAAEWVRGARSAETLHEMER